MCISAECNGNEASVESNRKTGCRDIPDEGASAERRVSSRRPIAVGRGLQKNCFAADGWLIVAIHRKQK